MEIESKLAPVLREGVQLVKMVFFKELKGRLTLTHGQKGDPYISRLSGAVVNELFGTPSNEEPFLSFAKENASVIQDTLSGVAADHSDLLPALTDALRVQFLCDSREGIDSQDLLTRARELNILDLDRDIPLPKNFMTFVRQLGVAHSLLQPLNIPEEEPPPGTA
jgi:hypothetical protein